MTKQTNSSLLYKFKDPALSQTNYINLSIPFNLLRLVPYLKSEDNKNLLYLPHKIVARIYAGDDLCECLL